MEMEENDNNNNLKNMTWRWKRMIERWRIEFFTWFGYMSLRPQDVVNRLHLYYIISV